MDKNINAIEKIISELSMKDLLVTNPIDKDGTRRYSQHRPYSLSDDTLEALEIKKCYCYIEMANFKSPCLSENYPVYCH